MTYAEWKEFLARFTAVHELADGGARVAVCPNWQGRVMTSTCGGPAGPSFGFINRQFIEAGQPDPRLNNYGGEERLWLSPEGGPFSLWFAPGEEQVFDNWYTQAMLNEGAWPAVEADAQQVAMHVDIEFRNTASTQFQMTIDRTVRLLQPDDYKPLFGDATAQRIADSRLDGVGYETSNRLTNRDGPLRRADGLVSMWILGMMNAGERTVVIVPYRPGSEEELGPVVKSDYFGPIPSDRLIVTPEAVLLKADAHHRGKLGISSHRASPVAGSMDFETGVLTLVHFSLPENPKEALYLNNQWGAQDDPFTGDATNAYNDGPNETGSQLGAFYEIESLSPAAELAAGQSLEHCHRTIHLQGDAGDLDAIARDVLGVDLKEVRAAMFAS